MPSDNAKGYVLLLVLAIATGLSAVVATFLNRTAVEVLAANRSVLEQQAFHLAEAGLDEALSALNADALGAWPACPGELPCREQFLTTLPGGEIRIRVFDGASPLPHLEVEAFLPTQASPSQHRRLEVDLEDQTTYFDHAAYNPRETPVMAGAISLGFPISGRPYLGSADPAAIHVEVDAYHSALGPYDLMTNRSTTQGSLATLAPALGGFYQSVFVDKDDIIWGDVLVPSAAGTVQLHNGGATIPGVCTVGGPCPSPPVTGTVEALENPRRIPAVSVPNALTSLPSGPTDLTDPLFCKDPLPSPPPAIIQPGAYGDLVLSGCTQQVKLAGADYRFTRIVLETSTLVVPSEARIYLSGAWNTYALVIDETADMVTVGRADIYFHGGIDFSEQAITPLDPLAVKPSDLALYGVRGAPPGVACAAPCFPPTVTLGHDAVLIGVIHNIEGSVALLDDSQMFGSILAGRWGLSRIGLTHNSRFHYDLALQAGRLPLQTLRYRLVSWREVNP